jgi:hypothetical protein
MMRLIYSLLLGMLLILISLSSAPLYYPLAAALFFVLLWRELNDSLD